MGILISFILSIISAVNALPNQQCGLIFESSTTSELSIAEDPSFESLRSKWIHQEHPRLDQFQFLDAIDQNGEPVRLGIKLGSNSLDSSEKWTAEIKDARKADAFSTYDFVVFKKYNSKLYASSAREQHSVYFLTLENGATLKISSKFIDGYMTEGWVKSVKIEFWPKDKFQASPTRGEALWNSRFKGVMINRLAVSDPKILNGMSFYAERTFPSGITLRGSDEEMLPKIATGSSYIGSTYYYITLRFPNSVAADLAFGLLHALGVLKVPIKFSSSISSFKFSESLNGFAFGNTAKPYASQVQIQVRGTKYNLAELAEEVRQNGLESVVNRIR